MDHAEYSRKRSRSPYRRDHGDAGHHRDAKRRRSRSPDRKRHKHSERKEKLPFQSHHLHRHDFQCFRPLFAEYLSLQKDLEIDNLEEREVQGRWKSFLKRWNAGELAEGWYDPETRKRADERANEAPAPTVERYRGRHGSGHANEQVDDDDEDAGYGPSLPINAGPRLGPAVPGFQELQQRRELAEEDRENRREDQRWERKQDRKAQKERLEELVPRAAAGTRERQLEKKRDVAMSNRSFAEAKEGGAEDVGEKDLLGDDEGGFKARKQAMERQKNERELRKEEILRAREAEREEKLAEHRRKEEKTMEYLRSLAQQRFGGGT